MVLVFVIKLKQCIIYKPPISGENQSFEINNEVIEDYLKNLSGIIKEKQIDLVDDSNKVIKQRNDWGNDVQSDGKNILKNALI